MDEEVTTSFWISFFVEAGIPPAAAANYAILFTENRIQKHMLLDLNKEYLKDMGVNVLGDIIAILKHSKRYHEKVAREKVLAIDKETSVQKATKHLNEMLLKDELPNKTMIATVQQPVTQTQAVSRPSPPKKLKTTKPEVTKKAEVEWVEEVEELEELKRKVIPPKLSAKTVAPAVTTAKTGKKTSVFDRLGESNVTSTTPEIMESPVNTALTAKPQQSSVFRRLGGIQEQKDSPVTITKPVPLKTIPLKTIKRVTTTSAPVAKAVEVPDSGKTFLRMDTETSSTKQSARERLGLEKPTSNRIGVVSTKVVSKNPEFSQKRIVRPPKVIALATQQNLSGVKQRLGSVATVKSSTTSSSSSVFKRLGVTRKEI